MFLNETIGGSRYKPSYEQIEHFIIIFPIFISHLQNISSSEESKSTNFRTCNM